MPWNRSKRKDSSSVDFRRLIGGAWRLALMLVIGGALLFGVPRLILAMQDLDALKAEALAEPVAENPRETSKRISRLVERDPDWAEGYVQLARLRLELGDAASAEQAIGAAASQGVDPKRLNLLRAHAKWMQGDPRGALTQISYGYLDDDAAYAARLEGRANLDLGNLRDAGQAFDRMMQSDSGNARSWIDMARYRWRSNNILGAVEAADRALDIAPNDPRALELRGDLALARRGPGIATAYYRKGLKARPKDESLLRNYARALADSGRNRDMVEVVKTLLVDHPRDSEAVAMLGVLAARAGNDDMAAALLDRAGEISEEVPGYLLVRSVVALRTGNAESAVGKLGRLARMQPNNVRIARLLALAQYRAGEIADAHDTLDMLTVNGGQDDYVEMLSGRVLEAANQRRDAYRWLERAARPVRQSTHILDDPEESLELLRLEASEQPSNPVAVIPYLRALAAAQAPEDAIPPALSLVRRASGIADAHILVGDMKWLVGDKEEALEHYRDAQRLRFDAPVMRRLYEAYRATGREMTAASMLAEYRRGHPADLAARRLAFDAAFDRKDIGVVIREGEVLRARLGNSDPRLLSRLSLAYLSLGRPMLALERSELAYRAQPSSSFATRVYGLALLRSGNFPKAATEMLEKAQSLDPSNPEIARQLEIARAQAGGSASLTQR